MMLGGPGGGGSGSQKKGHSSLLEVNAGGVFGEEIGEKVESKTERDGELENQ